VIDWEQLVNNDFLLVSQFSVTGALSTCRPDLVGFVNGLGYLRTVKKTWIPLLLLAWALGARAGEASKYAEQVAPLIDPAKLATLGERGANPRGEAPDLVINLSQGVALGGSWRVYDRRGMTLNTE